VRRYNPKSTVLWNKVYINLKLKKKKEFKIEITYIAAVESVNTFNPYLLPLSSFFNFDFSFLILPDIISDNIPVPFL
jgi:hypothetical protein